MRILQRLALNAKLNNAHLSVDECTKTKRNAMHGSKTFTLLERLKHKDSNNLVDLFGCLNGIH